MNSEGFKNKSLEMIFGSKTYVQTAMFMQVLIFHLCVELCNKLNASKYLLLPYSELLRSGCLATLQITFKRD